MMKVALGSVEAILVVAAVACSGATNTSLGPPDTGDDGFSREGSSGSEAGSGGFADSGVGIDADATTSNDAGTGAASDGAGGDASSQDAACTAFVEAVCARLQACAPFAITYFFGDLATCAARGRLNCPSLFNSSGTGASPSAVQACARAYPTTTCDDLLSNKPPSACVFQGSLAAGAACGADAQCSSSAYCNIAVGQTCGACAPRLAAGGTCSADANCQTGMVCFKQNNAPTGSCVVPGGQGATCDATHPCLQTLGCSAAGTCGPALGAGAPCSVQNCDFLHGLYCNTLTRVCARIQESGAGNPCGITLTATYAVCTASGRCALATGSTTSGTCEATAADGAMCDAANGPPCLGPAVCQGGVCTLPDATRCH
jgi:hypothetical protein